jgi:hypothetical protein
MSAAAPAREILKAPFPWFGGKSRAADLVWSRLGNVANYVEPFAGSLAVLLGRTSEPRIETVNDRDCFLANFWRSLQADPASVAACADWPVNECDLHARHLWLCDQTKFREKMLSDPDFYDAKIAGWWAWGISQWIGGGWCSRPEWAGRGQGGRAPRGINTVDHRRVSGHNMGVVRDLRPLETRNKRPIINRGGRGVTRDLESIFVEGQRPTCNISGVHAKRPNLSGSGSSGVHRKIPIIGKSGGRKIHSSEPLLEWMFNLANRLRRVRVICGDWARVVTPSCTWKVGGGMLTGVLLDPPYSHDMRDRLLYSIDLDIAAKVRVWATKAGQNPQMRIALCGLEGEHDMPASWETAYWKPPRGYSKEQRKREVIWFSPACLRNESLFDLAHESIPCS